MRSLLSSLVAVLSVSGTALAGIVGPDSSGVRAAPSLTINAITGGQTSGSPRVSSTVYDNTTSAANFGFSSANLSATYGDTLNMTGTGTLEDFTFSIYNSTSGGNAGALNSCTANISFFRQSDSSLIGSFTGNVNFGSSPLPAGFYTLVSFTGLSGLVTPVAFDTANVIVTQSLTNVVGATTRLGIASLDPVTVGSSPNTMYIADPPGTPAGFYNIGSPPLNANPGYLVGVIPAPSSLALIGMGGLLAVRRRR
jgi:hypothetical protein